MPPCKWLMYLAAVALVVVVQPRTAAAGQKRALLVGISAYPQGGPSAWPRLNTSGELRHLRDALIHHGFAAEDIHLVEDGQATVDGIRAAFHHFLIAPARPGDVLFFHFSGHGQQLPDDGDDELDHLDESIVTVLARDRSARVAAAAGTNIRDDELGRWLKDLQNRLLEPNGKQRGSITVSMDTCFSGTLTRGELVERGQGWDRSLDDDPPTWRPSKRGGDSALPTSLNDDAGDYVLLSAAGSNQTARERAGGGVFSLALARALMRADRTTTYETLNSDIARDMTIQGIHDQNPELEGDEKKLLFSGEGRPADRSLAIQAVRGDTLTLAGGRAHLVTQGSLYVLHRPSATPPSAATVLGTAEVTAVDMLTSTLKLLPGQRLPSDRGAAEDLVLHARAWESQHRYEERPLRVAMRGVSPELRDELGRLSTISVESPGERRDVELRAAEDRVALYRPESAVPFACVPLGPELAERVGQLLRAEWRWRTLLELADECPELAVQLRVVPVTVELQNGKGAFLRPPVERRLPNREKPLHLEEGDDFFLELENPSPRDLYVTVLELGIDGSIASVFPHPRLQGDGLIRAKQKMLLNTRDYLLRVRPPLGRTAFKTISTTEPTSLATLVQQAYSIARLERDSTREQQRSGLQRTVDDLHPIARLLFDTVLGERGSSVSEPSRANWGISTYYFQETTKQHHSAPLLTLPDSCR